MSNTSRKREWFGESGKIDSAEIRRKLSAKQSAPAAPEKRYTIQKTPGTKFPDLAVKCTKSAQASNRKRMIDLLEKSPLKL